MMGFIKKYPIGLTSLFILVVYILLYFYIEGSVYQTLPYDAPVEDIDKNQVARNFFGKVLKPDSEFYVALGPLRGDEPHPDMVILNLDGDLIAEQNTWPLARRVHADVFNKLAELKPKTVMLDMIFEWPQAPWVLESLGSHINELPQQTYLSLIRELNFDGQLKNALSKLDYTLIYILARNNEFFTEQQRKQYSANMARLATQSTFNVTGEGETRIFPYQRIHGARTSILPLQLRTRGQGFAWVNTDRYGSIASAPLFHRLQTKGDKPKSYYLANTMAEAARVFLGEDSYSLHLDNGKAEYMQFGDKKIYTDAAGEMTVNFYGRKFTSRIPIIRAHDLLTGKVSPEQVTGKLVVFGSDTNLLHDYHNTPVGKVWGTELVAYGISNILNGDNFYKPLWAAWLEIPLMVLLFIIVMLAVTRLKPVLSLGLVITLGAVVALLIGGLFIAYGMLFSITVPVSLIVIIYLQATTMRFVFDERQKRLYKNALGLYLSPQLTEQVSSNPALLTLDGAEQDLTVLFSDIRSFTTISESMTPEELTSFLHSYLSPMTDIVFDTDGTLDKYIGDAVMAFWGAPIAQPNHAVLACEAALQMLEKLDVLREGWRAQGLPPMQIGIGLNSGSMRVGNMGSDRRLSYTVMGDNVNLGARLEGLTKQYGVRLIVSENTWLRIRDQFHGRELDRVKVKGKDKAVPIHEVMGRGAPQGVIADRLADWEKAMTAYRGRDWGTAERIFTQWLNREDDLTAKMYLKLIDEFRRNPPADGWDAVSVMTTK